MDNTESAPTTPTPAEARAAALERRRLRALQAEAENKEEEVNKKVPIVVMAMPPPPSETRNDGRGGGDGDSSNIVNQSHPPAVATSTIATVAPTVSANIVTQSIPTTPNTVPVPLSTGQTSPIGSVDPTTSLEYSTNEASYIGKT